MRPRNAHADDAEYCRTKRHIPRDLPVRSPFNESASHPSFVIFINVIKTWNENEIKKGIEGGSSAMNTRPFNMYAFPLHFLSTSHKSHRYNLVFHLANHERESLTSNAD